MRPHCFDRRAENGQLTKVKLGPLSNALLHLLVPWNPPVRTERTIAFRVAIPAENTTTIPVSIPIIDLRRQVCNSR
jgi:hypothetical protein